MFNVQFFFNPFFVEISIGEYYFCIRQFYDGRFGAYFASNSTEFNFNADGRFLVKW